MVYSKFMQIETELISIEYTIVYVYAFSAYVFSVNALLNFLHLQ